MNDPHAAARPDRSSVPDPLDLEFIGAEMSVQFFALLDAWTDQMQALAGAGIDPSPLVGALGRMLRMAADQLEPLGGSAVPAAG